MSGRGEVFVVLRSRVKKYHETPAKAGIPRPQQIPHYATLPENPCKSE